MTNTLVVYSALVMNHGRADRYALEFEDTPTFSKMLVALQAQSITKSSKFDPAISSALRAVYFGGHSNELFNESGLFQHRVNDDAWLRVYCPTHCCESQIETENWL